MTFTLALLAALLAHDRWAVREQASDVLRRYSWLAAAHLQTALSSPDAEVRERAGRLIEALPPVPEPIGQPEVWP